VHECSSEHLTTVANPGEEKCVKFFNIYNIGKILFIKYITFEHWLCVIVCAAQTFKDKVSTKNWLIFGHFFFFQFYSVIFSCLAVISAP
jgi:hypothetical protein